ALVLVRASGERPRDSRATGKRDELAPLYPNHVIPRACAVWVRLKRTLAALAHFPRCLGRRDDRRPAPAIGGREFSTDLEGAHDHRPDRAGGVRASPGVRRA